MTLVGSLRTWLRESKVGETFTISKENIEDATLDDIGAFNNELPTINGKFVVYKLTSDARGYIFSRIDTGDALFQGDSDNRLDPTVQVSRFRPRYRKLNDEEMVLMDAIKSKATELETLYESIPNRNRGVSIAMTKLEESVMWAVKDLTK